MLNTKTIFMKTIICAILAAIGIGSVNVTTEEIKEDNVPVQETVVEGNKNTVNINKTNKQVVVTKHGHDYKVMMEIPATHETDGYTLKVCVNCRDYVKTDIVKAIGHDYKTTVVPPTCEDGGYTKHTCECGSTYTDENVEKLDHEYDSVVVEPTTSNKGYTAHTCTHCGHTYNDNYTAKLPYYKEVNETVYVTGHVLLNVRKGPGTSYDRVTSLEEGETVTRVGIGDNGWSQIKIDGETLYAASNFLTTKKPVVNQVVSSTQNTTSNISSNASLAPVKEEKTNSSSYIDLNTRHAIKHNYNGLSSDDIELIDIILDYCEKYENGEVSEELCEFDISHINPDVEKVAAYFKLEFGGKVHTNLYRIGEVHQSGEPTKCFVIVDAPEYAPLLDKKRKMEAEIERILPTLKGDTEEEMLKSCAEYLRAHLTYELNANKGADVLFTGRANCDGYAQIFERMALRLGIQCDWCAGTSINGVPHAWNRVTFSNGNVGYYDICWYDSNNGDASYLNRKDTIHNLEDVNAQR